MHHFMLILRHGSRYFDVRKVEGYVVLYIVLLNLQSKLPTPSHYKDYIFYAICTAAPLFDHGLLKNAMTHLRHPGNDLYFRTRYILVAFVVDNDVKTINSH